jgi:sensor histidine kinase YesM
MLGMATQPAIDDRLIRWIGIPLFGLAIPQLTDAFAGHGPREPVYYLGAAWFLALSWLIWHGNRWLLFEQRKHANWFGEPLRKILLLLAGVVFGTVPVTVAMFVAWYRVAGAPTDWRVVEVVALVNTICVVFVTHVYETVFLIKERESDLVRVERADRARAQAELDALRAQVDPHFLFNSLAALASLVEDQPAQAREFAERLARVYRYLLSSRGRSLVLLGEELDFVDDYARLLAVRFGGALRIVTRRDQVPLDRRMVPPVALQLLLENAVKHNELSATDPLEVVIVVEDRAVSVANPRRPRRDGPPSPGVGLRDLAARYRALAGVAIEIADGVSTFAVRVPLLPA